MSLPEAIREQVRSRAICACEFCGVTEADTGGLLTMDHFRPSTQGGSDALEEVLLFGRDKKRFVEGRDRQAPVGKSRAFELFLELE